MRKSLKNNVKLSLTSKVLIVLGLALIVFCVPIGLIAKQVANLESCLGVDWSSFCETGVRSAAMVEAIAIAMLLGCVTIAIALIIAKK